MEGKEESVGASISIPLTSEPRSYFFEEDVEGAPATSCVDKDFLCPICMQTLREAFLAVCGHSFCYTCLTSHLQNKKDCPYCGVYLTMNQVFPNFLLNKILQKASANQLVRNVSAAEHFRMALKQGAELSVKDLDLLLVLLGERKRKAEEEEAEANMNILLEFLHKSREQKQEQLNQIQGDISFLQQDIEAVEKRRHETMQLRESCSSKLCSILGRKAGDMGEEATELSLTSAPVYGDRHIQISVLECPRVREDAQFKSLGSLRNDGCSELRSETGWNAKQKRVLGQFEDLQECYLQKRRCKQFDTQSEIFERKVEGGSGVTDNHGLEDFQAVLTSFTRYSRLRAVAELRHADLFYSSNIVSSIEFDRDNEFFATAGVSRRIKVFEFAEIVNGSVDDHSPVVEMVTRSKLSCLSWNKFIKGQIASSDYDGLVTVWDVNTRQSVMEFEEHERRVWSIDFAKTEPSILVSGSDDGKVKIWSLKEEESVLSIDMTSNICSVNYNPSSSNYVAVGSADHHIYYYDLRNAHSPVHVFGGHQKTVSHVKFLSSDELVSASTDSTLRLWDVQTNTAVRTMKGHRNEKKFVGLTVHNEYIACGSETNEVFIYHKAMSKPTASYKLEFSDSDDSDDDKSQFISTVCWRSETPTMLAANSQGTIKVLVHAS